MSHSNKQNISRLKKHLRLKKQLVYKYLPVTINSLKLLVNGELWFGVPKNQNDPFEGEFVTKDYYSLPKEHMIRFYYESYPELLNGNNLQEKIDEIHNNPFVFQRDVHIILKKRLKEHYGISCFSYVKDNVLMWSNYANSHKGFCVIFDKDLLNKSIKYPDFMLTGFIDVKYNSKLCEAELLIEPRSIGFINEKEILFQKLNTWKKEKETRLLAFYKNPSDERNIGFDKRSISGIIFGEKMHLEDKKIIKNLIINDNSYSNVVFYRAFKDFKTLKMKIIKDMSFENITAYYPVSAE